MKVKFQDRKGREFAVVLETAELEIESTLPGDSIFYGYGDGRPTQVGDTGIGWNGDRVSSVDDISIYCGYGDGRVTQVGRMSISWSGDRVTNTSGKVR